MALPCQECYEHIVCLQMFWLGRDNCFTKDLYRLLHVQKLHNLSRSPFVSFILVIISKKNSLVAAYLASMLGFSDVGAAFPGSDVRRGGGGRRRTLLAGRGKAGWP